MAALNLASFTKPAAVKSAIAAVIPETALEWSTLDTATLSPDLQAAYFAYKRANDAATTLRKAFEAAMNDKVELDAHLTLAFGYRFGQLSVAIAPKRTASRGGRAALSLEQLIAKAG